MIFEAGFIYCKRHNIDYDNDFEDLLMQSNPIFDNNEFDAIAKDLRSYRSTMTYELKEITEEEYEMCVDEFGEQ
jgi:hypothetical protein